MKKIVLIIILFITMLSNVYAKEVKLVKEKISDITTYYYDPSEEKYRYLYAQKLLLDGNMGYCLEVGVDIIKDTYTCTESFENSGLNKDILEDIKLIAYYGYDYPGHNTDKYYLATQELIWKRISNPKVSWIRDLSPAKELVITKEKEEINNLINTHYQKPSFDNTEVEYNLGQELVLEDKNNVIHRYTSDNKNVIIEGNKLILTKDFDDEEIVLKKINYTGKKFYLYTSSISQKMMSTGVVDDVESKVKINLAKGTIEVTKLDKDTLTNIPKGEGTLEGAVYELYNEEGILVDTIITGTRNKIENLSLGKYTLKEKTPSKGYLLDEKIYDIEITKENLNIKLEVYEEVIKRKVEIFKVYASDGTGELIGEPNIKFEIYNNQNLLVDTIVTDTKGYTNIILPYGVYTFKQINSTKNYHKLEDFSLVIEEPSEKPIHKILSNSEIKAKIKIIKKDYNTKENIKDSNIKFKIFDVTNNKYISFKVSYPEDKQTDEFIVNKNGIFITPIALKPGKYILEEVKSSMNGYLYNDEKITFEIGENSAFVEENNELYLEVAFYNKRVKGIININKIGEEIIYKDNNYSYKDISLEGVAFNLYAKEDIYENGKLIYKKDSIIKELITDHNGNASLSNLPLGKYYIKEIKTSNNHILDNRVYDINLEYKDEDTEIVEARLDIKNYLPKGKIIINKYEKGTKNKIANTLIEIWNKENKVIYKGYTNKDGMVVIEDLPYGEYYLSEVEAATGYRILEDKINFEINKDEEIINIYNERIKVPNTGYTLNALDLYVLVITIIGLLLLIIFRKERITIIISISILILGITYFVTKIYNYHQDYKNNEESIKAYMTNEIEIVEEDKYQYKSILEIPSINLKRGILDINNTYNDAKYNIELIKEEENIIVLAAHNGNNQNSFFKDLKKLSPGEEILYYKDGILYKYIYSENYDIKKDGYADIYRKEDKKSIILITCKDNTNDTQTVHIGYLKEETIY